MRILNIIATEKAILIIVFIEMIGHAIFYAFGDDCAKWHFIFWMFWGVFIISCRVIINRNFDHK